MLWLENNRFGKMKPLPEDYCEFIIDGVVKSPVSIVAGFWQVLDIPYV